MLRIDAHSLSDFQARVEGVAAAMKVHMTTMKLWYRGQQRTAWRLLPSLYRDMAPVAPRFEREITRDFQARSVIFLGAPASPSSILFVMQHYGLPTRLLDWTTNPVVALFFAVEEISSNDDATVWVLSPWRLNELTARRRTVPMASHTAFRHYTLSGYAQTAPTAKLPLAVNVHHDNERVRAQDAAFTVHGNQRTPIEDIQDESGSSAILAKIRIPRDRCSFIKRELYGIGVHRGRLFPDLAGLSTEIAYRYSVDYWSPDVTQPQETRMAVIDHVASTVGMNASQMREMMAAQKPVFNMPTAEEFAPAKPAAPAPSAVVESKARQVAEQLILDIKKQNADTVEEGRRKRDLAYRLRNEIHYARTRFSEQAPADLVFSESIFDEQLVRILANGDRELLKL